MLSRSRDLVDGYPLAPTVVGSSPVMDHAVSVATRVAASNVKVLITGESGVGKDVFARLIHSRSPRCSEPFVALNCAGVAETLLESELFGHVKGSFTGAYRDKVGSFEQAHRGTIFLDEIGDMGLRMQALLLRFLETGELRRVGSDSHSTRVDVRIVSATNRDLRAMVNKGLFRDDLLYRIDVTRLEVPPLRERSQDIPELVHHLMAKCGGSLTFSTAAMRLLESYRWPGNVRELQNVVEQLVSLVSGRPVEPADLPRTIVATHRDYKHVMQDRRRSIAADLYDGLTSGGMRFWDDVHTLFTNRDITRADLRQLIRRGLAMSGGNYRGLLELFGMEQEDYKRLLNFLAAHDCRVEAKEFKPAARAADSSSTFPNQRAAAG
jgi:transcriptional regulator with GAF, ATPase, and Fis domain